MKITQLSINAIRTDGGTQPRAELSQEMLDNYAEAMKSGATFPAVIAFYDGTDRWLADGFHRLNAAKKAGKTEIGVEVHQGTQRDAVLYSVGANGTHGLPRTNADKRRAVMKLLGDKEWAKWSDREIAKRCAVGNRFVGDIRQEIKAFLTVSRTQSELPKPSTTEEPRTYTTRHGTTATMKVDNIGHAPRLADPPKNGNGNGYSPPRRIVDVVEPTDDIEDQAEDEESEPENNPPLGPVKAHDRSNGVPWHWSKAIQTIYEQFGIITKKGGIETLLAEWEDDETADYLRTLKDMRNRCDEYIPKIEEKLKCSTH